MWILNWIKFDNCQLWKLSLYGQKPLCFVYKRICQKLDLFLFTNKIGKNIQYYTCFFFDSCHCSENTNNYYFDIVGKQSLLEKLIQDFFLEFLTVLWQKFVHKVVM